MTRPPVESNLPLEKLNSFLKKHEFVLDELFNVVINDLKIGVKVKLLEVENYITVGEWKEHIHYEIDVRGLNKKTAQLIEYLFPKDKELLIDKDDNNFYRLTTKVDRVLQNFLKYWGIDALTMCKKIVNKNSEKIEESIIFESKMDSVVRKVVSDIISIVKKTQEGEFDLPSEINGEMTYSFPQLETEFSIDLDVEFSSEISSYSIDGEFSRDDDTIFVKVKVNPELGNKILYDLVGDLNELISHEITHIDQHEKGFEFPDEPKKPYKYYSQEHELEAQLKGFKRKSKITGKDLEDVIKDWFQKNQNKHNLKPRQINKIIKKIMDYQV